LSIRAAAADAGKAGIGGGWSDLPRQLTPNATKPLGEETRDLAAARRAAAECAGKSPPPATAKRARATGANG
jgi:hypothetical protein